MTVLRRAAVLLATLSLPAVVVAPTATARPAAEHVTHRAAASPQTSARGRLCANGRPTRNFRDNARDARKGIDITTLSVWNKDEDQCVWTTVSGYFDKNRAQVISAFYDTDRTRKGFEYQAFAYSNKDKDTRRGSYLVKMARGGGYYKKCDVLFWWRIHQHQIGMGIPKTCLGNPGHVRVRVALYDITTYKPNNSWRGYVDDAPNKGYTALY